MKLRIEESRRNSPVDVAAMLILCDFDGTITEYDITDLVWHDRVPPSERDIMASHVLEGRWTMLDYISHGYGFVKTEPTDLLRELKPKVQIRNGWERFVETALQQGAALHIVSNGLSFYICQYVPASIPISCLSAQFDDGYRIELPMGFTLSEGEEFKMKCVQELSAGYDRKQLVYVGDGRADFQPALLCQRIFAVRGRRLAAECRDHAIEFVEFDSFDTVTECLFPKHVRHSKATSARPRVA